MSLLFSCYAFDRERCWCLNARRRSSAPVLESWEWSRESERRTATLMERGERGEGTRREEGLVAEIRER